METYAILKLLHPVPDLSQMALKRLGLIAVDPGAQQKQMRYYCLKEQYWPISFNSHSQ